MLEECVKCFTRKFKTKFQGCFKYFIWIFICFPILFCKDLIAATRAEWGLVFFFSFFWPLNVHFLIKFHFATKILIELKAGHNVQYKILLFHFKKIFLSMHFYYFYVNFFNTGRSAWKAWFRNLNSKSQVSLLKSSICHIFWAINVNLEGMMCKSGFARLI